MLRLRRSIFCVLGLACILGVAAPALQAGVIMVSPSACDLWDTLVAHKYFATDQFLYMISWDPLFNNTPAFFYAPLNLPHGAVLKKFVIYFIDNGNGTGDFLTVGLKRVNVLTGVSEYIASLTTMAQGSSPNIVALAATSLVHRLVNDRDYSYCLEVQFGPSSSQQVQFCGARIEW